MGLSLYRVCKSAAFSGNKYSDEEADRASKLVEAPMAEEGNCYWCSEYGQGRSCKACPFWFCEGCLKRHEEGCMARLDIDEDSAEAVNSG